MTPSRSALFVPGNRPAWIEKAVDYGADTLILDLEDSVPPQEKAAARATVKAGVKLLRAKGQACAVRVNAFATGLTLDDLEAVICPELERVLLPKVETPADLHQLDALLTHLERRMGIPDGQVETPLGCETAKAMRSVYEIAFHKGLIQAMEEATKQGIAAVTYQGDMVDEAMVKTSRELLAFARAIGLPA
jgi:citrate lyase subunit beta/citryl-CoA lyase